MKILIVSPSWIGDTVISHSLYRLLFMRYSTHLKIDVITPLWSKPIINRLTEVNTIFVTPYQHKTLEFMKCYHLSKLLKDNEYQQAIILPNSLKSSVIPWLSNIPIRTGWRGEMRYGFLNDLRILNTSSLPLMVQRYAALAYDYNTIQHFSDFPSPFPLPQLYVQPKEIIYILKKFNLNKNKKQLIGLCPGSEFGPIKCWPYYHYITLAIQLIYCGYHVIILGSFKEQFIKKFIEHSVLKNFKQHYHNLIGKTSLNEAIIILAACTGIISNDSGLMHIACALNQPVVIGLYGNINDTHCTPPLLFNSKILCHNKKIVHYKYQKRRKGDTTYGYNSNLINITPTQVLKTLHMLLY